MRAVILGGGISGLMSLISIKELDTGVQEVLLVEKKDLLGGLVVTKKFKDCIFDFGPHIFHSKIPYILKNIRPDLESKGFYPIKTYASSCWNGTLFDYPMSADNILNLPRDMARNVIKEIYERDGRVLQANNFEDYVTGIMGKTLFDIFFRDYTEKLWGERVENIPASWAPQRISFRISDKSFFGEKEWEVGHSEGIQKITDYLWQSSRSMWGKDLSVMTETICRKIDVIKQNGFKIHLSNGEIVNADLIISSIPLTELMRTMNMESRTLEYRATKVVCIVIQKQRCISRDWFYFVEKQYPFTRIFEIKNILKEYPSEHTGLTVEYHMRKQDRYYDMPDDELIYLTVGELSKLGIIQPQKVIDGFVWAEENTYPVQTFETERSFHANMGKIRLIPNVIVVGRLGKYRYMNMDDTLWDTYNEIKMWVSSRK